MPAADQTCGGWKRLFQTRCAAAFCGLTAWVALQGLPVHVARGQSAAPATFHSLSTAPASRPTGGQMPALFGVSVQVDPLFGNYYKDRSPDSIASELRVNGYGIVRYIVVADSQIDRLLVDAFHRAGMGVWYGTFGNGTYSRKDLPAGWERWRMVTRSDLAGEPMRDGFTRLCLNHPGYRAWRKERIARVLKSIPFEGVDLMEPHWPEHPGPESPAYACFCQTCAEAFGRHFPNHRGLPDIIHSESPRAPGKDPGLWRDWLTFRRKSLTDFVNDLVNGAGGIREQAPDVKVCTWTLALGGPSGVQRVLEDHGENAAEIVSLVKPDQHCFQTHWPDWLRPDLPADYVKEYRSFIDGVRAVAPRLPLMVQADVGSKPDNRRGWAWIVEFERTCRNLGVAGTTFYEYSLGDYIRQEPPRLARACPVADGVALHFTKRLLPASATDLSRYELSVGRVTGAKLDGSIVNLSLDGIAPRATVALTVRGLSDDPERRLFRDSPAAVLGQQMVHFVAAGGQNAPRSPEHGKQ